MHKETTAYNDAAMRRKVGFSHWKGIAILLVIYDIIVVNLSFLLGLWFRFDCHVSAIPDVYMNAWMHFAPIYTVFCIVIFALFRLYRSLWRFASFTELIRILLASVVTGAFHVVFVSLVFHRMPVAYYCFGILCQIILIVGLRFSYRFVLLVRQRNRTARETGRVMLIGAGSAGRMILHDLNSSGSSEDRAVCIIDDNPNKWKRYIDGVPIVGGRDDILANVEKYRIQKIFLTMPSATAEERRDILDICKDTGCELRVLPGLTQFVHGQISVKAMKDVSIEDLLGRDPIKTDLTEVFRFLSGKTVLVTGGGGSIGSELCRQIASHAPRQLILFDVYENNAYDIQLELREKYPDLNLVTLIGSVRDSRRMYEVFATYRPEIVYHAAAHKHVPLMEDSPNEAIKNNVIGTYKTAYAAMMHGCERFVLISTDKAVNPTNIMGASKRLCEMIIQSFDAKIRSGRACDLPQLFTHEGNTLTSAEETMRTLRDAKTEFVAVRFGNVLGSNGSVIPVFKKQIEKGGPVTVTDPEIIRYFMTIPEAVGLVLLAGTYAKGGEIFVLDMGSPVKIDALARNLIRLSGYKPDVDIKIVYTGLRPGEKLYEEKLMAEEGLQKTENELIHIGHPIPFETDHFLSQLAVLMDAAYENAPFIFDLVEQMVSTYHPANPRPIQASDAEKEFLERLATNPESAGNWRAVSGEG